ncbi:MAG TPA: prepilin peptidase [Peptococcaceae bacterium]|nr:prepilin peptidase [Peptococcaceae bacterium]HPZ71740.1 prepilin peptidase [Peptococcaceae bacterium]HQD53620.1 prepilin peptidase [Peptococcaceae bacterium]
MLLSVKCLAFFVFLLGLVVGSFLNVCIYRIPRKESIIFPGSHCPSCQQKLQARDLIPLFSYLFLRGKCRFCGEKISLRYPLIELSNALGWLGILALGGWEITSRNIAGGFLFSVFLVITMIDLKHLLIPNVLVACLLVSGLIYQFFWGELKIMELVMGIIIGFGVPALIAFFSKGGMGGGDIKLCAAMGAWLGYPAILYAMFLGALVAAIVSIFLLLFKLKTRKDPIPFGPFLVLGFLAVFFFQEEILAWYFSLIEP